VGGFHENEHKLGGGPYPDKRESAPFTIMAMWALRVWAAKNVSIVAPASRNEARLWGLECDASGDIRRHQCSLDWSTLSHDCPHLIAGIPSGRINGTLTYAF
jgi:hypothetical protein